jgi:hypothetical protein
VRRFRGQGIIGQRFTASLVGEQTGECNAPEAAGEALQEITTSQRGHGGFSGSLDVEELVAAE